MNFFAALFLMLFLLQDKPAPQAPTKQPAAKPEQKVPPPAPTQAPVVLPKTKSIRATMAEGKLTTVEMVEANGERRTLSAEEIKQLMETVQIPPASDRKGIVFENGALYIKTGSFRIPLSGGGASGCFSVSPERNEQIQKEVRRQFEQEKTDTDKQK